MSSQIRVLSLSCLLLFVAASFSSSQNRVLNVPSGYKTIGAAIQDARDTDTILVAPGNYQESNLSLLGKAVLVKGSGGAAVTTIDAAGKGSVFLFRTNEGPKTRVEGFTLVNGSGTVEASQKRGGALFCVNASPQLADLVIVSSNADLGGGLYAVGGNPVITSCVFQGNAAPLGGGGMYLNCTCCLVDSDVVGNTATQGDGGGIHAIGSLIVLRTRVRSNECSLSGGGIYTCNSFLDVRQSEFTGNSCGVRGGGISTDPNQEGAVFEDNVVSENSARDGGGMFKGGTVSMLISRNAFHGNKAENGGGLIADNSLILTNIFFKNVVTNIGGGIYSRGKNFVANNTITENTAKASGSLVDISTGTTIVNSILWNPNAESELWGAISVTYCTVRNGWTGTGNLSADPRFVDPQNDDFHLTALSPCLNSGTNAQSHLPEEDFEGDPRKHPTTVDMGADEFYPHLYHTGKASPGNQIQIKIVGSPGQIVIWAYSLTGTLLEPPVLVPGLAGGLRLEWPFFPIPLAILPKEGIYTFPFAFSPGFPAPSAYATQAVVGFELTNADVISVVP